MDAPIAFTKGLRLIFLMMVANYSNLVAGFTRRPCETDIRSHPT